MAVAETADLAVRLSLNDKQFGQAINRIDRRLGAFSGAVNRNLSRAIDYGAARAARALAGAFTGGVEALRELEVVTTQTNAVIKSTGGIAGVTADEVRNLSEKYESLNATIDDKVIQSAQNTILTFTRVRKEAFEPALQAVLDYATATGTDAVAAAKLFGRALNSPSEGLGRLARVGIEVSAATEKRIKAMEKEGDLLGAQKLLLDEIAKRYGGSFAANADTAAAKQAKLADAVEDLQKAFAGPLLPIVTKVGERLAEYASRPETIAFFEKLGTTISGLFTDENLDTAAQAIETAASFVSTAITAFNALPPEIKALAIGALTLNKVTGGAVGGAAKAFGELLGAGLKQIFAANVTVIGKNVVGGGGVPGAGGPSGGGVAGKVGTAVGVVGAGVGGAVIAQGFKDVGDQIAEAIHEGNPQAIEYQKQLLDVTRGIAFGPLEQLRQLPQNIESVVNAVRGTTDAARNVGRITRSEGRASIQASRASTRDLKAAEARSLAAFRASERSLGGKLNAANGKLGVIARKDLSVKVNVSNPVSVATYVRGVAVSTRYGGNFSVTAV